MSFRTPILTALLALLAAAAAPAGAPPRQEPQGGLALRIEAPQTIAAGEHLIVRVSLENTSAVSCHVLSYFDAEGAVGKMPSFRFPKNILFFEVASPGGKLSYKGLDQYYDVTDPATPGLDSLNKLPPGAFFGDRIDLSEGVFRHTPPAPGTYRIQARLESDVRDWFAARVKDARLKADIRRCAPQGTLVSNTVTVQVKK